MCGLNSLVLDFNVKPRDIYGSGNVIIRSEISIEKICSLRFQDIKEGVTLRRLILWSIECIGVHVDLANCNESLSLWQLMWGT